MILKPGDRVICIGGYRDWVGIRGTVEDDDEFENRIYDDEKTSNYIPIRFDTKSKRGEGHDIGGIIKPGEKETGWWFRAPYGEVFRKIKVVRQPEFDF